MPLQVYLYIGTSKRLFEYENGERKSLSPQKTYQLDDSDFHVKSWFDRGLLVLGDAADLETETGDTNAGNGNTNDAGNSDENNNGTDGNGPDTNFYAGEIPDHMDESGATWFYFGWSRSDTNEPWQVERQNRSSGQSSYVQGTRSFQTAWQNRQGLAFTT